MIKLIATDVDGTLFSEGTSNPAPIITDTISQLVKKGYIFAFASGRSYESIVRSFPTLENEALFIANNGATITKAGRTIKISELERGLVRDVIDYMNTVPGSCNLITTESCSYTDSSDSKFIDWIQNGYKINLKVIEDVRAIEDPVIKLAMFNNTIDAADAVKDAYAYFGDRISILGAGDYWVDFIRKDVDKGKAVEYLQECYNVTPEETMTFGDNLNDMGLMLCAANSYAVYNARVELKEAAGAVLPDDEEAVIKEMGRLL